ncbi:MAG: hypothetical protein ACU0CI_09430 [Shimia sp.]
MSEQHIPKPVENYTNAFLWCFGLLLFMTAWVMAAVWGFAWVVICAAGLDMLFQSWKPRPAAQTAEVRRR